MYGRYILCAGSIAARLQFQKTSFILSRRSFRSLRVLFIGSDELVSLPVLKFLHLEYPKLYSGSRSTEIRSIDVLTRVNTRKLNPVAKYSLANNLTLLNWDDLDRRKAFGQLNYDLGVLSSFGKLIPPELIDATDVSKKTPR